MSRTVEAQASLLRATQLLWAASVAEIDLNDLTQVLLQDGVRMLVWQAAALLPDSVPVDGAAPKDAGLLTVLEQVETELRTRPIWEYPAGTSHLVMEVCDLVSQGRAGDLT